MRKRSRSPIHWLVFVLSVGLACGAVVAGFAADYPNSKAAEAEAKAAKAEQEAMTADMTKLSDPAPMHALLDPVVGKWKTVTQSWSGTDLATEGTCERAWLMNGRFLQSKYKGTYHKMPFEGMELVGYNPKSQEYSGVWIDNMGTMMSSQSHGRVNPSGKVLTLYSTFDDPVTGKTVPRRLITKIVDRNFHTFTVIGTSNGKEYKEMEIRYTRVQ